MHTKVIKKKKAVGVGLFDMQEYTQVLEQPHLHLDVGNTQETIVYKRLDIFKLRREKMEEKERGIIKKISAIRKKNEVWRYCKRRETVWVSEQPFVCKRVA